MSNHKIKDNPQIKNTKIIGEIIPDNHLQGKLDDELIINVSLTPGVAGKSAYEIWLEQGHTGTEKDFLNWLKTDGSIIEEDPTVPGYVKEIKYEDILAWKQAYEHSQKRHAPVDAQKNSDITQSEIENKLIGTIITHNHDKQYVRNTGGTYTGDVEFKDSSLNFAAESSTKRAGLHWYNNGLFSSQIGVIPRLDLLLSFGGGENPTSISLKDKRIDISKNTFFKEKAYSASTSDKDPQNTLVTKDYVLGKIADADVNVTKEKIEEVLTGDITSHHHDERYDQRYVKLEDFTNIYTVKGHVATYNDLLKIKDPKPGDVYNVLENGQNYVWIDAMDGQKAQWDKIGAAVDLTGYATESWVKNQQYTTEIDSIVQTTANVIGWEKNILFNADKKFTVIEPNQKAIKLNEFFNGTLAPTNVSNISPDNPYIIEISGLPTIHTQGKGRVGWISRYRYPVDFKFEYFNGTEWILIDDVKNYNKAYYYSKGISGVVRSLRFTVYSVVNMEQAYAQIAQLVFIHPEAAQMYDDLLVKYKDIENFADQKWVEEQIANNKLPDNLAVVDKDNKFTKNQSIPKALELEHAMNLENLEDFKVNELGGINLFEPDLEGKEYLGDGWYFLNNTNGIHKKYNVLTSVFEFNGKRGDGGGSIGMFYFKNSIPKGTVISVSIEEINNPPINRGVFYIGPPITTGLNHNEQKREGIKLLGDVNILRIYYVPEDAVYDKYQFRLKIEEGDKATPYSQPFVLPYYDIKVPQATSDLLNDSQFTTEEWVKNQLYITENDIKDRYATRTWVNNQKFINESTFNAALNNKVDKDGNKVLTDVNFTKAYEDKLKGIEPGAQKNPYSKTELDSTFVKTSGGDISGRLNITHGSVPMSIKRTGSNNGVYAAVIFERESNASGNQGAVGLGIGGCFKASNASGRMTHVGLFGGRLAVNTQGSEIGEVIFSPAYANTDPYTRADFRIRATGRDTANTYITGDMYINAASSGVNGDKVASEKWVEELIEAGVVDLNEMAYFKYAGRIYGSKYSLLQNAWEHSLTVDPSKISENGTVLNSGKGKEQYPNGEIEGVIIPQGVTSIGDYAFYNWRTNKQPLVVPNSVTSIGIGAFRDWTSNNQPLVIPDSVTSIGTTAFSGWNSNNHPLVIPDSVTTIGDYAFYNWTLVPHIEMKGTTPPTLANANAFSGQGDAPIYVPDESVDDYKTATNWVSLAHRIFPISIKPKKEVGLENVDNIKQATKTEFDAHKNNVSNPHNVTKAQIGLGNVENKSSATIRSEITASNIPNLNTSKITDGRFIKDRLPIDTVYVDDLITLLKNLPDL